MKNAVLAVLALSVLGFWQAPAQAQSFYTYDGSDFSVQLESDASDNYIVGVYFSAGGEWYPWTLDDVQDYEQTAEGGFRYYCADGAGVPFTIDYYRDLDYIVVYNENTGDEWTLNRRIDSPQPIYYTYDGPDFSVQLVSYSDGQTVDEVYFSSGGEWYPWTIDDVQDFEATVEGGFRYYCGDGAGVPFTIDYYRDWDYITVYNEDTGDQWTLNRR